jgi:TetR/AcrR family transcriptional regulator
MVSQRARRPDTPARDASSRDRLLAAAAAEFAARGFDGAKVDRITRRARINKAMLYYHFTNKAALYRAIVGDLFATLATNVAAVRAAGGPPDEQLRTFIATIASEMAARPHFPPIWLREMAEGGRHLDLSIVQSITAIVGVLGAILQDGEAAGVFRPAHPLITQMGIVAPLLLFSASQPVRERFSQTAPPGIADVSREAVIRHVEAAVLAVLAPPASAATVPSSPSSPPSRSLQP